ncbi:Antilisterial bacteriocin subtilosin biosynthesis protein AlbA [Nymphon striatum]|nr:Antilisterial bacteriocin subtilosin biosynthesis protein AlbA [Nymphon striatum]
MKDQVDAAQQANAGKFSDPFVTAKGEDRASVSLTNPETLWFNTGTLCNIECENCYILSSPSNDALVYLTTQEVEDYLDQLETRNWNVREIAFTGGEPFMNPNMCDMTRAALSRGYDVLILTNAMRPMMRKSIREELSSLISEYRDKLTLRISLDHWSPEVHDKERGKDAFAKTIEGMLWLRDQEANMAVAGRSVWAESDASARDGIEVPEITTSCWGILDKSPDAIMCSSSRMVVKRKGADKPAVLACTLLAYSPEFELGETLEEAERDVQLNHPHCAKFCVLGGASCSA